MSDAQNNGSAALTLEFDAPELYVSDLSDLVADLRSVVGGLAAGLPESARVRWVVEGISMASPLRIAVAPTAYHKNRPADALSVEQLPSAAVAGVSDLLSGVRPQAFNDSALDHLRDIYRRANKRGAVARLSASGSQVEINAAAAHTVDTILEPSYRAYGTVEGRLDLINAHRDQPLFGVYDELTGRRVDCAIGKRIPLAEAAAFITRRVAVEGEISYRPDGHIVRIAADRLTPFPSDDDLPSAHDVLGILSA